jgi:hypothetical protein
MNVIVADDDRIAAAFLAQTLKRWAFGVAPFVVEAAARLERMGREGRLADASAALDQLEDAVAELVPEIERTTLEL